MSNNVIVIASYEYAGSVMRLAKAESESVKLGFVERITNKSVCLAKKEVKHYKSKMISSIKEGSEKSESWVIDAVGKEGVKFALGIGIISSLFG